MKQKVIEAAYYSQFTSDLIYLKDYMREINACSVFFTIYSSTLDKSQIDNVCQWIEEVFPTADYYGCTSFHNIADSRFSPGKITVVCTMTEDASTKYEILLFDRNHASIERFSEGFTDYVKNSKWIKSIDFMMASPIAFSRNAVCEMAKNIPAHINMAGGCAFNEEFDTQTSYVFSKGHGYARSGMCILLCGGDNYYSQAGKVEGWKPLYKNFVVTKVSENKIIEIDDRPAAEIYDKYLGIPNNDDFVMSANQFPLFYSENGTDYVLRNVFANEPDGSLIMSSNVAEGARVQHTIGEVSEVMDSLDRVLDDMTDFVPDCIRLYSCAARLNWWGHKIDEELSPFGDIAPASGLFTAGEFVRINGELQFCNCTLVTMSVREGAPTHAIERRKRREFTDITTSMRLAKFIGTVVSELDEKNRELTKLALYDMLSGVYNRGKLDLIINDLIRKNRPLSLIMMDIDDFKQVNDTYGHDEGDRVIQCLARVLLSASKNADVVTHIGRWGGEEFMIAVESDDASYIYSLAEDIRVNFSSERYAYSPSKTLSIGIASLGPDDDNSSITKRVDEALYAAKAGGKNRVIAL